MYITNGRKITLKRGIAEWFNEDCPVIEYEDGERLFSNFIDGVYVADEKMKPILYKFIKRSYEMACKKYNWDMHELKWLEDMVK